MKTILGAIVVIILMIGARTVYALTDTQKEAGVASDAQGRVCNYGPSHDRCLKPFIQELNKPLPDTEFRNDVPGDEKGTLPTRDACYDAGLDDGKNDNFDKYIFDDYCGPTSDAHQTENRYYKGFIDGCLSVEGNTRQVCEANRYGFTKIGGS